MMGNKENFVTHQATYQNYLLETSFLTKRNNKLFFIKSTVIDSMDRKMTAQFCHFLFFVCMLAKMDVIPLQCCQRNIYIDF